MTCMLNRMKVVDVQNWVDLGELPENFFAAKFVSWHGTRVKLRIKAIIRSCSTILVMIPGTSAEVFTFFDSILLTVTSMSSSFFLKLTKPGLII